MYSLFWLASAAPQPTGDSAVKVTLITTLGGVFIALITFLTTRYGTRKAAKASTDGSKVTERQVDVSEWQALLDQFKGETGRLSSRVEDLEERDEAKRERIDVLESTVSVNKGRISELERAGVENDIKYGAAVQYIRDLMAWAVTFISNDNKPPTPPPSIAHDLGN